MEDSAEWVRDQNGYNVMYSHLYIHAAALLHVRVDGKPVHQVYYEM